MRNILALSLLLLSNIFVKAQSFNEAIKAFDKGQYNVAFNIFTQLADLGHVDALNNLGTMYQTGKGTPINYLFAVEHYRDAAAMGHINAAYNLSNLTRLGIGTEKNLGEAYAWAILAARDGASDMIAYRDALEKRLNQAEITDAYRMATTLLEVLETQEMSIAWLLPPDLKNPLPDHLRDLSPTRKPKEKASLLDFTVPEGFSALTPTGKNRTQQSSFTNDSVKNKELASSPQLIDDVEIPAGFSALRPKGQSQQPSPNSNRSNSTTSSIDGLNIPDGFSALTPNQSAQKNDSKDTSGSIDGVAIPDGFSALTPHQDAEKSTTDSNIITPSEPISAIDKQKTYPTQLGHHGETLYRPQQDGRTHYKGGTLIKPRRVIPAKESTLSGKALPKVESNLNQIIQSLAQINDATFIQTFNAILKKNPKAFDKDDDGFIKIIDPNTKLIVPSKQEIQAQPK